MLGRDDEWAYRIPYALQWQGDRAYLRCVSNTQGLENTCRQPYPSIVNSPHGQLIGVGVIKAMLGRDDEWAYRIPYALQWSE
jgi:hypothetical protein